MISVIVCTHNRAHRLEQALKSLQDMFVPVDLSWELIVVDNNSNDNTKWVINSFIQKSDLNIKYFLEKHQGLSYARNMGVQESRGHILAFTDDDCIVDRHWISSISKKFLADEEISGISGRVELYNKMDRRVSIRVYREEIVFTSVKRLFNLPIGCNMSFRRSVFNRVGLFDTDFGVGGRFASAEDSDFLYRVYKEGLKIIYSPDVLVYHNHGRNTDDQIKALYRGYAIGHGAFYCKNILMADKDVLHLACSEVVDLIRVIIKKLIKRQSSAQQRLFLASMINGFLGRLLNIKTSKY